MNDDDLTRALARAEQAARAERLSVAERRELNELRRTVQMMGPPPAPPEEVSASLRLASPILTLTSGGIQYQVDIVVKQ